MSNPTQVLPNTNDYYILESSVMSISNKASAVVDVVKTDTIFDKKGISVKSISIGGKDYKYIPFGTNNKLPYEIIDLIRKDDVLSSNKFFNLQTLFGMGISYRLFDNKEDVLYSSAEKEIRNFVLLNNLDTLHSEMCTDMLYFNFVCSVIILNKARNQIVQIHHKDIAHIRLGKEDETGAIPFVLYSDWNKGGGAVELIPLLDVRDPLSSLQQQIKESKDVYKFAVISRIPTPSSPYYPEPSYFSVLRSKAYETKQFIMAAKLAKTKNVAPIKYRINFNERYFRELWQREAAQTPEDKRKIVDREMQNVKEYLTQAENSGKVLATTFSMDPEGNKVDNILIEKIDSGKEGGDYSEDLELIHNLFCYADQIHPNMVGATPGKSGMNNSGSDKRELFTLKQSLMMMYRKFIINVHRVVIEFNGWSEKVYPEAPMITLTTLDKKTDAQQNVTQNLS